MEEEREQIKDDDRKSRKKGICLDPPSRYEIAQNFITKIKEKNGQMFFGLVLVGTDRLKDIALIGEYVTSILTDFDYLVQENIYQRKMQSSYRNVWTDFGEEYSVRQTIYSTRSKNEVFLVLFPKQHLRRRHENVLHVKHFRSRKRRHRYQYNGYKNKLSFVFESGEETKFFGNPRTHKLQLRVDALVIKV